MPPPPRTGVSPPRRRRALWLLAAGAVLGLAALGQEIRETAARWLAPTGGAAWIWAAGEALEIRPRAFYAVRDFELAGAPEHAELLIQADEEYLLYLNGRRVGSNVYSAAAPLDAYDVGELLVAGGNRLVVELRSARGAGGLLLRLAGEGGEELAVSDESWRIFIFAHPGILGGWLPAGRGQAPKVWGRPPAGRWGRPKAGPERPLHAAAVVDDQPLEPVDGRPWAQEGPGGEGDWWLWDWGREIAGYLEVKYRRKVPAAALLFTASEAPPEVVLHQADGYVLSPAASRQWSDARLRRFRYAVVAGGGHIDAIGVVPVRPEVEATLGSPRAEEGLFGITVPRRLNPLEREVFHSEDDDTSED